MTVGRAEIMAVLHTNRATGKRYEHAMGKWLLKHSFHIIDKCTRSHLMECLKHRAEIEKWRAELKRKDEVEHFHLNHPTTVLRKWKAATIVSDPNAPPKKPSPIAELKKTNIELQEKLHRAEQEIIRSGGDLWTPRDTADAIAIIMLNKLSVTQAERVARAILAKLKDRKKSAPPPAPVRDAAVSADDRKAHYAAEDAV